MRVATLELSWAVLQDGGAEGETEQAARRGDRSAWNALVARHNQQVVMALIAHGVMPAQAREAVQEAWLRLISQADAHKLVKLLLPGLAIRQALYLAQTAARRERPVPLGGDDAPQPTPEQRYLTRERLQRARELLTTLPAGARRVFDLLYGQPQLSHAEIAGQVGLSVQRVRQIICEVRKVLRAELEGDDHV